MVLRQTRQLQGSSDDCRVLPPTERFSNGKRPFKSVFRPETSRSVGRHRSQAIESRLPMEAAVGGAARRWCRLLPHGRDGHARSVDARGHRGAPPARLQQNRIPGLIVFLYKTQHRMHGADSVFPVSKRAASCATHANLPARMRVIHNVQGPLCKVLPCSWEDRGAVFRLPSPLLDCMPLC